MNELTPGSLGLTEFQGQMNRDDSDRYWCGSRWDIEEERGRFHVYRKGHWVLVVGTLDLALAIVQDDEGR